jgi:hypothetical protein
MDVVNNIAYFSIKRNRRLSEVCSIGVGKWHAERVATVSE